MYSWCRTERDIVRMRMMRRNNMKYNWESMTDEQKEKAIRREIELETHNGTTKDDLLNMLRWLCEEESEE